MDDVAWIEARTLDTETVRATYALAARHVLADTAMEYHAVITVPELSAAVQRRSRIRTKQAPGLWMGDVLYRVAQDCHRRGEPLLEDIDLLALGFRVSEHVPGAAATHVVLSRV